MKIELAIRPQFEFLWSSRANFISAICHRNSGKTYQAVQCITTKTIQDPDPMTAGLIICQTLQRGKDTMAKPMTALLSNLPERFYSHNKSESKYEFYVGENDTRTIFLRTAVNPEKLRGLRAKYILIDEAQLISRDLFNQIILPILNDSPDSKLIVIGTPSRVCIGSPRKDGVRENLFKELRDKGRSIDFPNWETYTMKASDSGILSADYLSNMKDVMSPAEYAQEFECDFEANVLAGSVYGHLFERFVWKNTSDEHDYDPYSPVYTSWDLGKTCNTAIWFFQKKGDKVVFFDYHEDSEQFLGDIIHDVMMKGYNIRECFLPHDAVQDRVNAEYTCEQIFKKAGLKTRILPRGSLKSDMEHASGLLKIAKFNRTRCKEGLIKLEAARFQIDYKNAVKKYDLVKDGTDDTADSFRYAAKAITLFLSKDNSRSENLVLNNVFEGYNMFR